MITERRIGKVISVDSFRVFVKLDEDLKSLYKSGYEDIYEVARINSYIIIPNGADRIVALVTRVKTIDETEIDKDKEAIFLTELARYLVATMIGTIENNNKYIQGVYNYPVLDNPVWYVTKEDLDLIFDQKDNKKEIDFERDYYLPIGTSPSFPDYKIKINPDKFFGKHAAILGNTGSGKSCTLTSILHSLFEFKYNGEKLKNAHFIIFDTNGEYKQAFLGNNETKVEPFKENQLVNPFYIDKKGIKVPYWFMNFDDFDYLFEPSANTQAPILKRAIGLAKNKTINKDKPILDKFIEKGIIDLLSSSPDEIKKKKNRQSYGNWEYKEKNEIIQLSEAIDDKNDSLLKEIKELVKKIGKDNEIKDVKDALISLNDKYKEYLTKKNIHQITIEKNIDLPTWFSFNELITIFFEQAIDEQENSSNRIREFVSTLRLRLQSYLNDERIAEPLLLKQKEEIPNVLACFLAYILGDYCKIYQDSYKDGFSEYFNSLKEVDKSKPNQVTIIDMSLLPYEVLETITGLVGRLILEFLSRFSESDRGKYPIVLVLEEAQNYIPEKNKKEKDSISKRVFERISREGRKYGLSLIVSSQRPSELSKTVLSQCNSFIIHRLQNPEDQKYVRQLVSAANEDILQQLPILPQQHAIIMGDAVRTPVQVKIKTISPTPNSNDPKFIENWIQELNEKFPNYTEIVEAWEKGEKSIREEDKNKNMESFQCLT